MLSFRKPFLSTTPILDTSVATSVGANFDGSKIFVNSNESFPATILYPLGFELSETLLPFICSLGCSNFKYPFEQGHQASLLAQGGRRMCVFGSMLKAYHPSIECL